MRIAAKCAPEGCLDDITDFAGLDRLRLTWIDASEEVRRLTKKTVVQ